MAITNVPFVWVPGTYVEITARTGGLALQPHQSLLVGQIGEDATMNPGEVYEVDSAAEGVALAAPGSQLAQQIAAYRAVDTLTPLSVVGVADAPTATQASGSIAITGTATESRPLALYIAGRRLVVGVATGDTATAVATKIVNAATAIATELPVEVEATAGEIEITSRAGGSIANVAIGHSQLSGERPSAGLTIVVTALTGGATDPDYAPVIAAIGDSQYNTISIGLSDAVNAKLFATELERRWGPLAQIDGVAFVGKADTRSNLSSYVSTNFNSGLFYVVGQEVSPVMEAPWETAAKVAAISALQAQADPSLHPTGDVLTGSRAAKKGMRFTFEQRNTLLGGGISTLGATSDGRLQIERLVSSYTKGPTGLPDTALKDLHKVRTLSAMRFSFRAMMGSKYSKAKLQDDAPVLPSGQIIMTPSLMRAEIIALAEQWVQAGWMEGGSMKQFKKELVVQRSESDSSRLEALLPPDLMDNLFVTAARIAAVG